MVLSVNSELLIEFYNWMKERKGLSNKHSRDMIYRLRSLLKITDYKISRSHILRGFEKLKEAGLAPTTLSKHKASLSNFLKFLEEKENLDGIYQEIMREVNKRVKWSSTAISFTQLMKGLSKDDVIKGFRNLIRFEDKTFYAFLTVTGLRLGEALLIKVSDIDFDNRVVYLNYIRRTKRAYFSFFNEEVKEMLFNLINRNDLSGNDKLFNVSDRRLKEIYRLASYSNKRITAQLLRKFFATYSIENGMNPLIVDFLQGRVSLSVLTKHYFRPSIKGLRKEYDRVWGKFRFEV